MATENCGVIEPPFWMNPQDDEPDGDEKEAGRRFVIGQAAKEFLESKPLRIFDPARNPAPVRMFTEEPPTLRDRFALAALPMFTHATPDDAGKEAYRFADAAMKARGGG